MAKKTKTLHGWALRTESLEDLYNRMDEFGAENVLFSKLSHSTSPLKRMTIRITIEDYKPKRNK